MTTDQQALRLFLVARDIIPINQLVAHFSASEAVAMALEVLKMSGPLGPDTQLSVTEYNFPVTVTTPQLIPTQMFSGYSVKDWEQLLPHKW